MTYNLHPIVVHFPIALLFLYSLIKIIPVSKWFRQVSWKQLERLLLLAGVLGAVVASYTGEIAEVLTRPDYQLVEMHSWFAAIATWLYSLLLLGELLFLLKPLITRKPNFIAVTRVLDLLQIILTHRTLSLIMAFLGLVALSVTGLLGGVMVYGLSADPLAGIVLKLLGLAI